ncbi:hypothetical protein H9P43_000818 [Blastocladiella emersonii ATCC 22665]|nr:hypothetical protein H9P43_000818 [Blastocladiella emersonii ATCC 22665]
MKHLDDCTARPCSLPAAPLASPLGLSTLPNESMTRMPQLLNVQPAAALLARGEFAAAPSAGAFDVPAHDCLVARHAPLLLEYLPVTDVFDRQFGLVDRGNGAAPSIALIARIFVLALCLIAAGDVDCLPVVLDAIADERIMTNKLKLAEWVRLDPDSRKVVIDAYVELSEDLGNGKDTRAAFIDYLMLPVVATPKHGFDADSFFFKFYTYHWYELPSAAHDRSISTTRFIATLEWLFRANDLVDEEDRYDIVEDLFRDLCDGAAFLKLVQALEFDR